MFGKKKDFFGTYFTRYKILMDSEKQQKIAEVKKSMTAEGSVDIKELFLEKQKYFDALMNQHTILTRIGSHSKKDDLSPIQKTILRFIQHDRMDGLERLKPGLTKNQLNWALDQVASFKNQKNQVQEPQDPLPETPPEEISKENHEMDKTTEVNE